jgi:hypothetical protein
MADTTQLTTGTTYDVQMADEEYPLLERIYQIVSKYGWMFSGILGVPGNFIAMLVITLKHNRNLSPCIYITAMAIADNLVLLTNFWYFPIVMLGLSEDIVVNRELMFK